ncbi:MAG: phosphoenolpyruvate hydrolase family protein [Azospirillaceae bacterium]|nr:phosphoenolpyruvate hydrolase family protein [Azospirillaceae bacterium]
MKPLDATPVTAPLDPGQALAAWRRRADDAAGFLIGAAIGAGLVAQSAVRGGADFILALSAGRVRVMGAPSVACMVPIHETNAFVAGFARAEILDRVDVPVLFGASTLDPRTAIPDLLGRIQSWGFHGVANFPTTSLLDPGTGAALARRGLGWPREVALIAEAHRRGLLAVGYVRRIAEATDMAAAGADIICLNFGWTSGGISGEPATLDIAAAAAEARAMFTELRRRRAGILCFVEGGPIATPQDAANVCRVGRADGYIASSTIDRLPLETAVCDAASAFKAIAGLTRKVEAIETEWLGDGRRFGLIGRSPVMAQVVRMIERLADSDLAVLIQGASGTGKELVAQALHRGSCRRERAIVAVNCAAIPHDLLESELFGFERGAFTGATRARIGRFEEANGGTLFLDEIGDLELSLQGKLLRVLESGSFERLGSNQAHHLDTRIVCATNRDLRSMVANGRFREDLFYRLNRLEIRLPSLAERIEDIPLLAQNFLATLATQRQARPKVIDNAAYQILMSHRWPGNVRELRNVIQQAAILSDTDVIGAGDLSRLLDPPDPHAATPNISPGGGTARLAMPTIPVAAPPVAADAGSERDWILDGLRRHRFKRGETARYLGLSRKTLYNKMRRFGLE